MTIAGIKKIIREIFSEPGPGGTLSWGRVASAFTLTSAIVWVSHIVLRTHALPDLAGAIGFGIGPYASNKAVTAVQAFSPAPVNQTHGTPVVPPPMVPPTR